MRRSQMARRSVLEEIRRLKQEKLERKRQLAMDKAKERIAIEQRIKEMAERRKAKAVTSIAKVWRGYKVRVETARIKQARATASRLREQQRLEAKALEEARGKDRAAAPGGFGETPAGGPGKKNRKRFGKEMARQGRQKDSSSTTGSAREASATAS